MSKQQKILVNSDKYNGQYVAIKNAEDNTIVGKGATPEKALNEARQKGFKNPFIVYIPNKNLVHIYYVG